MAKAIFLLKEHGQDDKTYFPLPATVDNIIEEWGKDCLSQLLDLAAAHWYGKHATFFRDNGLKDAGIYGQICKPISKGNGLNCVTSRVRIDLTVNGQDVCDGYGLQNALKQG